MSVIFNIYCGGSAMDMVHRCNGVCALGMFTIVLYNSNKYVLAALLHLSVVASAQSHQPH